MKILILIDKTFCFGILRIQLIVILIDKTFHFKHIEDSKNCDIVDFIQQKIYEEGSSLFLINVSGNKVSMTNIYE